MPKDKYGILGTIIFHNIILLFLFFFSFTEPKEPLGIEGILINFGNETYGSGISEPGEAQKMENKTEQSIPSVKEITMDNSKKDIVTQDYEEAPAIEKKKTEKKQNIKIVEEVTKEGEKPEEKPKQVNKSALYSGKNKASDLNNSEGTENKDGNQGSPYGSVDSDNHSLGLGNGGRVSFDLEGRGVVSLPKPELNYQKQGIVVVEIIVDRQGNVVNANTGFRGSTSLDTYLLNVAKTAALRSKFTPKPDATFHQKGYITYHFILQSENF